MMTPSLRGCLSTLGACLILSVGATAQGTDPMNGVWKLNVAKSTFSPGPAPKESTLTIESAGPGRKVSVTGVAGDGSPVNGITRGTSIERKTRRPGAIPTATS